MKKIIMMLMLILSMLLFVTEGNAVLCPTMAGNKSFKGNDDFAMTVSSNRFVAMGFNVTGTNATEFMKTMGGATIEWYFWNGTAWDFDSNSSSTAGIGSSRASSTQDYTFVYNWTGNNRWWTIFNDPDIIKHTNFTYWNGSQWRANTTISVDVDVTPDTQHWYTAAANFPTTGRYVLLYGPGSGVDIQAFEWNGSNMTQNSSLLIGLNISCCDQIILSYNFSGQNRWNAVLTQNPNADFVMYWNGSQWRNETGITPFTDFSGGNAELITNWEGTGNATFFSGSLGGNTWLHGRFEYQGADNVVRSNLSASAFASDNVVVNLTTYSRCNATEMSVSVNNTGAFLPIYNQTISPAAAISSRFLNTTALNRCARTIALRVNHTDTRNTTSATNLTIVLLPAIAYHNASAAQRLDIDCTSSSNLTITANTTTTANVTLNMSGIFIDSNQTCTYGASRAKSVRNENKSSGCSVFVFEVSLTKTLNSTVGEATELSERGIGNIPAAIAAGSIATLIIVYAVTRKRRGE